MLEGTLESRADIEIHLQDVNEAPVITTLSSLGVNEGQTDVATLEATDEEGNSLSWSIVGGDDRDHFFIASSELGFHTAKDYEDPDDADGDGIYLLKVQVSDGSHDVSSDLWVQLRDVNEGVVDLAVPVISTLGPFHINEGETEVALLEATDGQGDPLSWSIVDGDDESHFSIVAGGVSNNAGELSSMRPRILKAPTMPMGMEFTF